MSAIDSTRLARPATTRQAPPDCAAISSQSAASAG